MYVSRLAFHTVPGKTHEAEEHLKTLREMASGAGATRCRILRTHFASLGSPDLIFELVAADLPTLEDQIAGVSDEARFRAWSQEMSGLLREPPKREVYIVQD